MYLCYLVNALTNTNSILKVDLCHLANILTNINNKTDDFIREKVCLCPNDYSLLINK